MSEQKPVSIAIAAAPKHFVTAALTYHPLAAQYLLLLSVCTIPPVTGHNTSCYWLYNTSCYWPQYLLLLPVQYLLLLAVQYLLLLATIPPVTACTIPLVTGGLGSIGTYYQPTKVRFLHTFMKLWCCPATTSHLATTVPSSDVCSYLPFPGDWLIKTSYLLILSPILAAQ